MNETTLASFRPKLKEIHFSIIGNIKDKNKTTKEELNEHVADIIDDAIQSNSRQLTTELGEQDWKKMQLVEEAIKRLNDGEYGVCLECKEQIPQSRLKAIPFTTHCIDCLEVMEKKNR